MTCILGWADGTDVYMGCDSAASDGYSVRTSKLDKVFQRQDFLIGYTSSFRMGQLLEHTLFVEKQEDSQTDMNYLVTTFVPAVRKCLKEGGYTTIKDNEERIGQFLVGYRGNLYEVDYDLQINTFDSEFAAVGCGAQFAVGAFDALLCVGEFIPQMLETALEVSARHSAGVRGPFKVRKLEKKEKEENEQHSD